MKLDMYNSLDDMKNIENLDRGCMLKNLEKFPKRCRNAIKNADKLVLGIQDRKYSSVIVAGLGGSAIGGHLIRDWLYGILSIPVNICSGYHLPKFVNHESLVFIVSYSGDTEETISMFNEALRAGCRIISVTSGGKLGQLSRENNIPLLILPSGVKPRAALPDQFFSIVTIMRRLGLFEEEWSELEELLPILDDIKKELSPQIPTELNEAKKLALKLKDVIPFIFGSIVFRGAAYRFCTQLNENSKSPSSWSFFPEAFHNAIRLREGRKKLRKNISVVIIKDESETLPLKTRIDGFQELLEDHIGDVLEVYAKGNSTLSKIFSVIYKIDYITTYLGLLYGLDPSSNDSIDILKKL